MVSEENIEDYLIKLKRVCTENTFPEKTIRTYSFFISEYLQRVNDVEKFFITNSNIQRYVHWQRNKRKRNEKLILQSLKAIRFFAKTVLKAKVDHVKSLDV